MIEKYFNKQYKICLRSDCDIIPKSTLTRIANRLLKEYIEVNGDYLIPDEIKTIIEKIKSAEDAPEYEDEHKFVTENKDFGDRFYDTCVTSYDNKVYIKWTENDDNDPVYWVYWYFFTSEQYTKTIGNKKISRGDHLALVKQVYLTKGNFRYLCTYRPPTSGGIPEGYITYETYLQGSKYIGEVTYNRELTDEEMQKYGLVFDVNYSAIRDTYLNEV